MTLALSGGSIRQIYNGASRISTCLFLDKIVIVFKKDNEPK